MAVKNERCGETRDGEEVRRFTLRNGNGLVVRFLSLGCRLTEIQLPGERGGDILLGCDTLAGYENDRFYHGALVGRYAGRIRGGSLPMPGGRAALSRAGGEHYLHGSLHRRVFDAEEAGENSVLLRAVSPDGEDGFPGELAVSVRYSLSEDDALTIEYFAAASADTHVNLTSHPYFDLSAGRDETIEAQTLRLHADRFLELDAGLCPTGRFIGCAGTPFDFSSPKPIGRDINADDRQLKYAGGYDHCFALNAGAQGEPSPAAVAEDPESGLRMTVLTTQPGIQFYSGNFLSGGGKGRRHSPRAGFCLEAQRFPDSPNHPRFPSTLLKAGDEYRETTVLRFGY